MSGWVGSHHPLLFSTSAGLRAVEFLMRLSGCIAIEVVGELLTQGLLGGRFFGSDRRRSSRTFFALLPFIAFWLLGGLLSCRLLTRHRFVRAGLLLVRVLVVAGHESR